jgi:hypothetical protein
VVADPLNITTTAVETHSGHIVQGFGLHNVSSFAAPSSSVRNNALLGEVGSRGHEVGFCDSPRIAWGKIFYRQLG